MTSPADSPSSSAQINVTPLIDVLLVLLIIFMVITPLVPRGLPSAVPQGKASEPGLPPVTVRVQDALPANSSAAAGGRQTALRFFVDGRECSRTELAAAMQAALAARVNRSLFIRADRSLSFQQVALAVGFARQAGATAIALSAPEGGQ